MFCFWLVFCLSSNVIVMMFFNAMPVARMCGFTAISILKDFFLFLFFGVFCFQKNKKSINSSNLLSIVVSKQTQPVLIRFRSGFEYWILLFDWHFGCNSLNVIGQIFFVMLSSISFCMQFMIEIDIFQLTCFYFIFSFEFFSSLYFVKMD